MRDADESGDGVATGSLQHVLSDAVAVALAVDPLVGVSIVDVDGLIHFINDRCAYLYFRCEGHATQGARFQDLFPPEWVEERLRQMRLVDETGRSLIVRHIRRGVEIHTMFHKVPAPVGVPTRILGISVETGSPPNANGDVALEVIESDVVDLGELDVLTRREIEVLALLGQGMGRAEIAEALFRSPKTVDKHLESISAKLRVSSRIQLARIGQRAGLTIADSSRIRTHE